MLNILLILIFIRPFISSLAFPCLNAAYSVLFLLFLLVWIITRGISIQEIQPVKYPLALFCLALLISIIFSLNPANSLAESHKYVMGIILFLIAASLNPVEQIKVINTLIFTGLIISFFAIYQYSFSFRHLLVYMARENISNPFTIEYITRARAFFPFVTPNTLGGYLAMLIPLSLAFKNKFLFIIPLSLALLLTKSLGAIFSLFVALGIYFYLEGRLQKRRLIILFTLLVIFGFVLFLRTASQKQHLQPLFSTIMRLSYWRETLKIIRSHFLTGVGLGNFNLPQSRYAHNSYLQIWAETGIWGIASFLLLIVTVFKFSLQNIKIALDKRQIAGIACAAIVFLIHNLLDFSFFLPEINLIWWVILGLLF